MSQLGPADLLDAVPGGDVSDLVPDDRRHLSLRVEVGQNAPRDVDEPPGQGEGVDRFVIDDLELPGQVGSFG